MGIPIIGIEDSYVHQCRWACLRPAKSGKSAQLIFEAEVFFAPGDERFALAMRGFAYLDCLGCV